MIFYVYCFERYFNNYNPNNMLLHYSYFSKLQNLKIIFLSDRQTKV